MTCQRYWQHGILIVERGEPDPHLETCLTCRREHELRGDLIHALPLIGKASSGDPTWEARVWRQIAGLEPRRRHWRWTIGGFATTFLAIVVCWAIGHHPPSDDPPSRYELLPGDLVMRSRSPGADCRMRSLGDRVRISVKPRTEVRVYRADRLVLRCPACPACPPTEGCSASAHGLVAEAQLAPSAEYRLVVITSAVAAPVGQLDRDLEAVVAAGGDYQITELSVH